MNGLLGVDGLFFVLGLIQIVAVILLSIFMKETQGLTPSEKKVLFTPVHLRANESKQAEKAYKMAHSQNGALLVLGAPLLTENGS